MASESLAVSTTKAILGVAAPPVVCASLVTLISTGCGLRGELPGTLEGVAYVIVLGISLASTFTRVTTGLSLAEAELRAAGAEVEVLQAADASEEKLRASAAKAAGLANGPARLLVVAEQACLVTTVAALLVFASEFCIAGSLPSPVPTDSICWR